MKSWKPALTILCCLFMMVSAYQTGKQRHAKQPRHNHHHHHHHTTKKMVPSIKGVKVQLITPPPPKVAAAQVSDTTLSATCLGCNPRPYSFGNDEAARILFEKVKNFWNLSMAKTPFGERYVRYIQTLDETNDNFSRLLVPSIIIGYYFPYLGQEPDACAMAGVIKAMVACRVNRTILTIQSALEQLQKAYVYDISKRLGLTIDFKSGCNDCEQYPPESPLNKTTCAGNGFEYPIQEVLDLPSNQNISINFKKLLLSMYDSANFNDKFFAVCTIFALSGATYELWNPRIIAEIMDLTASSLIEPECCYRRLLRTREILKILSEDSVVFRDSTFKDILVTRCGQSG